MKRILVALFYLICCVTLIGCSFSISTAKIEDAMMTTAVDDQGKPVDEVTTFAADAAQIVVSTKIRNAPDDTEIRFALFDSNQEQITEATINNEDLSDRYIYCIFTPNGKLTEGVYKIEIYIDENKEPDATVKFSITPIEIIPAVISKAQMTTGIGEDSKPIDKVTTYEPNATFVASAFLQNASEETKVRFIWRYLTQDKQFLDYPLDAKGQTDIYVSCNFTPDQPMPEGDYQVDIYIDGQAEPSDSAQFSVKASQESDSGVATLDLLNYTSDRLGFSIGYPKGWEMGELDTDAAVVFYSNDYIIEDEEGINTVLCMSFKDIGDLPTLEEYLNSEVEKTAAMNLTDYALAVSKIKEVNGHDMALHAYSYIADGKAVTSLTFFAIDGRDLYQISFLGIDKDIETLGPIVSEMAHSFVLLK